MKNYILIIGACFFLQSCGGEKKVLSSSQNTCLILPVEIEEYVDMFVDEVDGNSTKFNLGDSVEVDEGEHKVLIRLEYQPAAGTSVVVGGIGNILLRAATNKTFVTEMDISVVRNLEYRFVVSDFENGFHIDFRNETSGELVVRNSFELKDGELTRIF